MATADNAPPALVDEQKSLSREYCQLPIVALGLTSRKKLATYLDGEGMLVVIEEGENAGMDITNNYAGIAELANFTYTQILSLNQRRDSPTMALLDQWNGPHATIGNMWKFLHMMDRRDVLTECRRNILSDCSRFVGHLATLDNRQEEMMPVQDPRVTDSNMRVDETKFVTIDDSKTGETTYYDLFICYSYRSEDDRQFVREMIAQLEDKKGLKLFVPGRNDIPGSAANSINAFLIEKRCKRIAILLSKTFAQSEECDFQVKFAQALEPGARNKKLIPIIRDRHAPIPRILRFLALCDFTMPDMNEWSWDRLYSAIIAPIGRELHYSEGDENDPFLESTLSSIKFPSGCRLDDEERRYRPNQPTEHSFASSNSGEISSTSTATQQQSSTSTATQQPSSITTVKYVEHFV